jgi:hypothetical protein
MTRNVTSSARVVALPALLVLATSAAGISPATGQAAIRVNAISGAGPAMAGDPLAILDLAHTLEVEGRFPEARSEYHQAAEMQRAAGEVPARAMWRLAQLHYGEANGREAATVLVALAKEAGAAGDPVLEARAILEATLLYAELRMRSDTERGARRLRQLRSSGELPAELVAEINRRLATR